MLTELKPEHRARMDEWADMWIERGLSTERADWDTFERAVAACYQFAGLEPPRVVVRCPSPLVAALAGPVAAMLLEKGAAGEDVVKRAVWGTFGSKVDAAIVEAVYVAVMRALRPPKKITGVSGDVVQDAREAVTYHWARYLGGQFWLSWQAYTSFFRDVCGLKLEKDLWARDRAYADAQQSVCWWWPHADFIMASDRPLVICREQVGPPGWGSHQLHCEDGPAMVWPDGWGVWSWHGVRVPRHVIEAPETITVAEIKEEKNAEVRRVMRERYGHGRYLQDTKAKLVDADHEVARKGAAPRCLIEDDEGRRWLVGTDGGTRRVYYMEVGAEVKTCKEAHESLCGFDESAILSKS